MKDLLQKTHLRALMLVVLLCAGLTSVWGAEETVTFSEQGYENAQEITSYNGTNFSIAFDKGTNSSVPKYYTSGTAIRAYGGNTFTVSSNNNKITKIEITFGTSDGSNAIKVDGESISNGKWTGSASSVKFTIDGTSGNRRLSAITVTTGNETATPTITASNVTLAYDATEGEIEYSISNPADGEQLTASTDASWISNINVVSGKVTFETTTNEGQGDRTASITLSYPNATNKIVTVTQEHFVIDYVTLPFAWEGGTKNNLTALTGVKGYGLGSDYADSHGQYRVKFDNDGDYIQIKTNEQPGKVTIGVKMIGGASASKITVQGSADGETFRNIQELTIKGASNQILTLETTNDFASTHRYVRLSFTKGANVGVGPISISRPFAVKTPVISLASGNYFEAQNVTISCETDGATIYYTIDGTEPSATNGTQYTASFTINSSATLKAIAIKGDDASAVASATYTFPVTYNNIAALVEAAPTETVILTLTDAQVLYVNNKDMYVKDATGALDFYNCGLEYAAGQILNGTAVVNYQLYTNGLPEITSVDVENSNFSATDGVATPEVVSAAELTLANDICKLVQVKGNYDNKAIDGVSVYNKWGINDIDLDNFSASVAKAVGIVVPSKEGTPNIALISIEEVPVVAQIGTQKFETLQAAVDAALDMTGDVTIELTSNIEGYAIVHQKAGLNLTIDGKEKTVAGQVIIDGDGRGTGTETLTIQNIKFEGKGADFYTGTDAFVLIPSCKTAGTPYYTNKYNYAHNITISGCSFTSTSETLNVVGVKANSNAGAYNVVISNSTGINLHSLAQLTGTTGSTIENCQLTESDSFVNIDGGAGAFNISGCTFISSTDDGYAVREKGSSKAIVTLTACNFTAAKVIQLGKNDTPEGSINVVSGSYNGSIVRNTTEASTATILVSGGIFSQPVAEEYCADDYISAANPDEETNTTYPYIVRVGQFIAEVGGVKYESFTEAVAALTEDNNTITLLAAVEDAYTLAEGQTLNVILGENTLTVLAPEGYLLKTSVADGVTTYSYAAPVAKIGDTMYASLAEAVAAVPAGEETAITMIADETIVGNAGVMIPVGKNVVLDLNGKTITLNIAEAKASQLITNRGTLTITDSSEEQNGKLTNAADESLPVGTWPDLNFATNIITNSGTLNVEGGTIQNNANGSICYAIDNNSTSYDAILNVKGGRLTAVGTVIRQFCNSTVKQNILNVSGGIIETNGSAAIWTQLPGSDANSKKLATLNISGGKIKGATYAWYDYSYGDSFEAVNYSITGGEITGYLYSYAKAKGIIGGFVSGGLFSEDVSSFCIESLTCTENTDEATKEEFPYLIGKADIYYSWMENGQEVGGYYALATPFVKEYLMDGEFITLQKDITLKENIACLLAEGSFNFRLGEYNVTKGDYSISLLPNVSVLTDKQTNIFSAAASNCYIKEAETENGYSYTAVELQLAAPIIFHDGGTYEGPLTVAMAAADGAEIYYATDGENFTKYTQPLTIDATTTLTAYATLLGVKSDEVSKTYTITEATAGPAVEDNYYTITNNGNNKYVCIAGRKTVIFADNTDNAGTVIRVKTNAEKPGQLEVIRSQGIDLPAYAEKAMNYVPKIVELIVDKLHAEGSGELLGENGLDAIMAKFKESFDYHLYLEEANGGYRIYGRTPSMQPVVDFYAENKANVDAKLPGLEAFINSAIEKVLQKTNGSGASILVPFSLQTVWEKMGSTLTEPVDEASTAKFYEEVLSSEANVWNFAYETAMIYWSKLKGHPKFQENLDKLGDYAKYIDKVENIRPNFKYYIVQKNDQLDFISQGNSELNAAFTTWTLAERTDFSVAFPEENVKNAGKEHYTTLYTDFAYTLPEGVKAYKITAINETTGVATTVEISGTIPAQTPVLLSTTNEELTQTLTLNVNDAGSAPTDNLLVGPDYLINTYNIKTEQVEGLFNMAKELLGENAYSTYLAEYEHLMMRNSGTVNNKYFFGLDNEDLGKCADEEGYIKVRSLGAKDNKLCFFENWDVSTNKAFLINEIDPVLLSLKGDVNRDGKVTSTDAVATVDIVLVRATPATHADVYDFDAADANENGAITIDDVVTIVNMVLGR